MFVFGPKKEKNRFGYRVAAQLKISLENRSLEQRTVGVDKMECRNYTCPDGFKLASPACLSEWAYVVSLALLLTKKYQTY